jgi:uncharacterized membrane protein
MAPGLVLGLLAALCWGLTDIAAALGGRRFGSLLTLGVAQLTSVFVLLGLGLAVERRVPFAPADVVPLAVVLGLIGTVAYTAFFAGLRIGPVSVVSPVVAAYGGLTVVLAVIVLGETIRPLQWLGATTATGGIVLAGIHFDGSLRGARPVSRGVLIGIVSLVLFAVLTVGLAGPIRQAGWLDVIFTARLANNTAVWLLLLVVRVIRPRGSETLLARSEPSTVAWFGLLVLAGLLDVAGFIAFAIGLETSLAWLVGLASSFGPAIAVLVAVALLGERPRRIQWAGLAGIAVGLVLVAVPA